MGVETFWVQAVCQNHIVWDAGEVVEFSRKHTANVHESLNEGRRIIQALASKRDERRDAFARVIERAMDTKLGDDADEVRSALTKHGIISRTAERIFTSERRRTESASGEENRPADSVDPSNP